ncbi:MAG: citrate transporter [candidate division KSB1 bacterium]|nr:citrate transporter [candidate division KSB1 bacterium]
METIRIGCILFLFIVFAGAMFLRKLPALICLPCMAFLIPLVAGVNIADVVQLVVGEGALRLHNAYSVALFGSMLSVLLQKTGVADSLIKKGAELAGDSPLVVALTMLGLITLLFTTLGGLGAIIMVATVVVPIMSSVGLGPLTVTGVFLMGISMGGLLNAGNWAVYRDVLQLPVDKIRSFALVMFCLTSLVGLAYTVVQLYREGHEFGRRRALVAVGALSLIVGIGAGWHWLPLPQRVSILNLLRAVGGALELLIGGLMALAFATGLWRLRRARHTTGLAPFWGAYISPLVPLLLILLFNANFISAFVCGLVYTFVCAYRPGSVNVLVRSVLEGGAVVMPAVALMLGIGMLLNAIVGPAGAWQVHQGGEWPVLALLRPYMTRLVPSSPAAYVLFFGLAAPLALYRGPLNVWGMGYGLAAAFLASGMSSGAIMGVLMAVGQVQGISDPTNTHNVWLANHMGQDVQKVLWNTIPYSWGAAWLGLLAASVRFM